MGSTIPPENDPCGRRVDWLRACNISPARVVRGADPTIIRWYFVDVDTPQAPPGILRSRTWLPDKEVDPDFGEVVGAPWRFVDGEPPPPGPGCPTWPGIPVPCLGVIWPALLTITVHNDGIWPTAPSQFDLPLNWVAAQNWFAAGPIPGTFQSLAIALCACNPFVVFYPLALSWTWFHGAFDSNFTGPADGDSDLAKPELNFSSFPIGVPPPPPTIKVWFSVEV